MPDKPVCPFCGSDQNLSGEHIWPDWLGRHRPSKDTVEHKTRNRSRTAPPEHRAYLKRPYRIKARGFCAKCNNGWMSDLDNAVKAYALPLIEGRSRSLHRGAQRLLSQWAILKTLAWSHMERERTIDQLYYDAFYAARGGDPPPHFEVFGARYFGSVTHGIAHVAAVDLREPAEAGTFLAGHSPYVALLSATCLVLKVYGRDPDGRSEFIHNYRIQNAVCRLWPPRKAFVFPPGTALGDAGLEIFMGDRLI